MELAVALIRLSRAAAKRTTGAVVVQRSSRPRGQLYRRRLQAKRTAKTGEIVRTLDVRETLKFFDDPSESAMGLATAVVGVLGEDLAAGLFSHCVEANKLGEAEVMQGTKVVRGGRKGPWLDRWIKDNTASTKRRQSASWPTYKPVQPRKKSRTLAHCSGNSTQSSLELKE